MRLFIGVWLSKETREEVLQFINQNKRDYPEFKWTAPENLHFTLKFLGEVDEHIVTVLTHSLNQVAIQNPIFQFKLGSVGFFPSKGPPRIIWIGVTQGSSQLVNIADSIEKSCLTQGFPKSDKPFKAHLTIARTKNELSNKMYPLITSQFQSVTVVTEFSLIESCLYPSGPVYHNVKTFQLNK